MKTQETKNSMANGLKWGFLIIAGIFVLATLVEGGQSVPANSVGVVTYFGKYSGTVEPGFHVLIPYVEKITAVPVRRQRQLDFGIGTHSRQEINEGNTVGNVTDEAIAQADPHPEFQDAITGDKNLVLLEWSLFYKISNPKAYLFNSANPEGTLRDMGDTAIHEVLGDSPASWALSSGRQTIEALVLARIQEEISVTATQHENGDIGLQPTSVQIISITVPNDVQEAFKAVSQAQQQAQTLLNVTNGQAKSTREGAKGEANRAINTAKGEAAKTIADAEGETGRFLALFKEYKQNPEIYTQRLTYEAWTAAARDARSLVVLTGKESPLPITPLTIPTLQAPSTTQIQESK